MSQDATHDSSDPRKPFLAEIEKDLRAETPRFIYADWLDDHGEHEEAERQRGITLAWATFDDIVQKCNTGRGEWDEGPVDDGYLIEEASRVLRGEDHPMLSRLLTGHDFTEAVMMGGDETSTSVLRDNSEAFWEAMSTILSSPLPPEDENGFFPLHFSCAC